MSDLTTTQKSWLDRPEGKVGGIYLPTVALALAGAAVFWFWGTIVPFVVATLANTVYTALLCGALFVAWALLSNPNVRTLLKYAYMSGIRAVTGAFIELDPIGILKSYVQSLQGRLLEMQDAIDRLKGQRSKLRKQIERNEAERVHSIQMMKEAEKQQVKSQFILQSRQAGRLEKSNVTLMDMLNRMDALATVLDKMKEAAEFYVQDIQGEVKVREIERNSMREGYNAFKKARSVLAAGDAERALYDEATEKLIDDYSMKIGEIESGLDVMKSFIQGVELENGVFEQSALEQLDAWEQKATLVGSTPVTAIPAQIVASAPLPALPVAASGFDDLFSKNPNVNTNLTTNSRR